MTYLKAVEAGVDVIDCAISPFALGTSQPATEVMVETFKGTLFHRIRSVYCFLQVPKVIEAVENPDNINTVGNGFFNGRASVIDCNENAYGKNASNH